MHHPDDEQGDRPGAQRGGDLPPWARKLIRRLHLTDEWYLIALAAVIGALTALGSVGFVTLLHKADHLSAEGRAAWPLWCLPLIPMAGALVTGLLVYFFASEAKGHGVPQVIAALNRKAGVIPGRIGVVKVLASICTVGTGGSAGAEGPIVQIGATAGSVFSNIMRIGAERRGIMVGCGAAAGIASVFNAPIAGVFFVLEILLRDFSLRTFTPIVVASVFSTAVTQVLLGQLHPGQAEAIFAVSLPDYGFTVAELPSFVLLGLLCASIGVGFTRLLHRGEDLYDAFKIHPIVKPVTGAAVLGLLGVAFIYVENSVRPGIASEMPPFFGNGYAAIRQMLEPTQYPGFETYGGASGPGAIGGFLSDAEVESLPLTFWVLLALVGLKGLATVFTLASGGSGGVFAPCLFIGAAGGGALGALLSHLGLLPIESSPASYALVGMAAMVSATTFAPLTAILLIFELTREPLTLLPAMLASIVATVTARIWMGESIYTFRLRMSGVLLSAGRDLTVMRRVPVARCQLAPLPPEPVHVSDPLAKLITLHAHQNVPDFVVTDPETGAYLGLVTGTDMRTALIDREAIPLLLVAELMRPDLPVVRRDETLDTVLDKFAAHDVASLCVVSPIDETLPIGVITRREVLHRYREALEEGS